MDNESIEQRAEGDIGRVLAGKASGVQITNQSGVSGSGTSIIIRGFNTFSQGNQPLFIVDGVPFSSETNNQDNFQNGNNGSSRFLDLDPNNIENVNVLKGLAAATLYGTQGRNGVILITTKSGSAQAGTKKNEITVNSSVFFNEIASLPDYQDQYGNGFDQSFGWFFSNWGPSFDEAGVAGWGNQNSINGTLSGQPGFLRHPFATASTATGIPQAFPEFADAVYEWKPYNNVEANATAIANAIHYERMVEMLTDAAGLTFFEMRKEDQLQKGTLLHFPIPGSALESIPADYYTYGGNEGQAGEDYSTGGWR